ncbi:hypothetical protein HZH68_008309 [Vespula germanica]|uniref:Uncharacterized protein n=1 Tax=Vespula germanica TaxID=30212 RepID=A0A834K5B9_VESGE|nr:hypothetical protein HZH68_008309 [Vespula germanica]
MAMAAALLTAELCCWTGTQEDGHDARAEFAMLEPRDPRIRMENNFETFMTINPQASLTLLLYSRTTGSFRWSSDESDVRTVGLYALNSVDSLEDWPVLSTSTYRWWLGPAFPHRNGQLDLGRSEIRKILIANKIHHLGGANVWWPESKGMEFR